MNKNEKIQKLNEELKIAEERHLHMLKEFSDTRAGSSYGVEYFEIQLRVIEEMIRNIKSEILRIKSND